MSGSVRSAATISVGDELLAGESLDTHGRTIAGAVVMGSTMMKISGDDLRGSAGDTTGEDGSFTLALRSEHPFTVVALNDDGWSELGFVPAGDDDRELTLRLGQPGFVRGRLERAGAGTTGSVQLTTKSPGVAAARILGLTRAAEDGTFVSPPLPPGLYFAYGSAGRPGDAGTPRVKVDDIVVEAGRTTARDIALPTGGKVELDVDLSAVTDRFVVGVLLRGTHAVANQADLDAARRGAGTTGQMHLFRGRFQKDDPWVFEDVQPGELTACIASLPESHAPFTDVSCAPVELEAGAAVASVKLRALRGAK